MNVKTLIVMAAILGGSGVAIGAFAAHSLEKILAGQALSDADMQKRKDWMETGSRYQMYHAAALLGLAALARAGALQSHTVPALLLILGTVIFSGCLYLMTLTGKLALGAIVPIGGVMLIVGWVWVAVAAAKSS